MAETIESARRWSGFVCPDCRMVFRVPRDHDGKGIVCPSCRRLLRVPMPGDEPPPLMVPLRTLAPPSPVVGSDDSSRQVFPTGPITSADPNQIPPGMQLKRRKRKKPRKNENPSWELEGAAKTVQSRREENRRMFWMLAGGGALLAVIVAGIFFALNRRNTAAISIVPVSKPAAPIADAGLPDSVLLTQAEPLARKFLASTRIEQILPLIRNPERAEARIRSLFPDGTWPAPGMAEFSPDLQMEREGKFCTIMIRNQAFEPRSITFVETADGLKVDWEAWSGWSEMSWPDFTKDRPTTPKLFRAILESVDYYNFAFGDENEWVSYRLSTLDGEHSLYGYTKRGSALDGKLRPPPELKQSPVIVTLKFPESSQSDNQVIIDGWLANCWVLENDPTP